MKRYIILDFFYYSIEYVFTPYSLQCSEFTSFIHLLRGIFITWLIEWKTYTAEMV